MARTAYVCLTDGAYQSVSNYTAVAEELLDAYQDGSTYRDLFATPTDQSESPSMQDGMYYPADGDTYVGNLATVARISDEIEHEPPRSEARKHTRLRFFVDSAYTVASVDVSGNWIGLPSGHEVSVGDRVSLRSTSAVPGGTSASTGYYIIAVNGNLVLISTTSGGSEVNITDVGSGTITLTARHKIADFKPGEWTTWSNAAPLRF
jgi:hypothetical protein